MSTYQPRMFRFLLAIAAILIIQKTAVAVETYPARTVKIVVPAPPGTNLDTLPRIVADKLATRWAHPVIIENRPGAAQNLGAEVVAKAAPDGYTLLATPQGPLVISKHFFPTLGFDPDAFAPISIIASQPLLLVARSDFPASSLKQLIIHAQENPGRISFASPGIGSSPHLTGEMLKTAAGIGFVHVPYKGFAPAEIDLLAGRVDMMFDNLGNVLPHLRDGRLKALGVASETRVPELPDVPAIAETFPGFYSTSWFAVAAPPNTAPEIVTTISQAIAAVLQSPDVVARFRAISSTPLGTSPAETAAFLKKESERWRQIIISASIKPE